MILFYRIIYLAARTLMTFLQFVLPEHLKNWILLRNRALSKMNRQQQSDEKSIWFHAASGEIEYVKNIIVEIKKTKRQQKIVVTYSSPSAEKLLGNIKDFVDVIIPLPWDQPKAIAQLIHVINPRSLVFAKTDFWPELIQQTKNRNIPIGVVAVAINTKSKPGIFQNWALKKMNFIFTSNAATTELLKSFNVTTSSDTRFDQVFFRLNQPSKFNLSFEKPLIVFGSTWPEDDVVLIHTVDRFIQQGYQLVWCPHDVHASSVNALKKKLQNKNFAVYSEVQDKTKKISQDILMIDQVGLLADIYRRSEIAFIGGSFKGKIHSVMEALCPENLVFFGPHFENNSEAIEFLNLGLAFQINSAEHFLQQIQMLTPARKTEIKQKLHKLCSNKKGPSKKIADYLLTYY